MRRVDKVQSVCEADIDDQKTVVRSGNSENVIDKLKFEILWLNEGILQNVSGAATIS